MACDLHFQYASALEQALQVYELPLFEDEFASMYFIYALAFYQAAQAALQGHYDVDGSIVPQEASRDPRKTAVFLLKQAGAVFHFLASHVLVSISVLIKA